MTTPEAHNVVLELERLHGTVQTGFARIDGRLALLVQRSDRSEADVKQLRRDVDDDVSGLRAEVEELKKSRWPMQAVTGVAAAGALGLALWEAVAR